MKKITLFLVSLIVTFLVTFFVIPAPALAQGPCTEDYYLSDFTEGYDWNSDGITGLADAYGPTDSNGAYLAFDQLNDWYFWSFALSQTITSSTQITVTSWTSTTGGSGTYLIAVSPVVGLGTGFSGSNHHAGVGVDPNPVLDSTGWGDRVGYSSSGVQYFYPITVTSISSVLIGTKKTTGSVPDNRILDAVKITVDCQPPPPTCSLVPNYDFTTTDDWLLAGSATITNSTLTLPPGGQAAQNISGLSSNTTYIATLIASNTPTATTSLAVVLGTATNNLNISAAGTYTTSFTTPSVGGPLAFGVQNTGSNSLDFDSICLAVSTTGAGGEEQYTCIAPTNGEFTTGAVWDFYRGASWGAISKVADLPGPDNGLAYDASGYNLPSLDTGEYLLLSFDALAIGGGSGLLATSVDNGSVDFTDYYETYPVYYTYEADLSNLAGETSFNVAFANAYTSTYTADIELDNVCIFVATRAALLPFPIDPNAISPFDFGFNFDSCDDVDALWAGFGVNMAQYRADYAAGFSFWDPTEWLVAAVFVTLGDWSCLFMAAFVALINVLEYLLNSIENITNWIFRNSGDVVTWAGLALTWLWLTTANVISDLFNYFADWANVFWATVVNIVGAFFNYLADWAAFVWGSLTNIVGGILASIFALMLWLWASLTNVLGQIIGFFQGWAEWLYQSAVNLINWFLALISSIWEWLSAYLFNLNGLRVIINWLIDGWNAFLAAIGNLISLLADSLVNLWNNYIYPFLQAIWEWLSTIPLLDWLFNTLFNLILAIFALIWAVWLFVYEFIIQTGDVPIQVFTGFNTGLQGTAFSDSYVCTSLNFWCWLFQGMAALNQAIGGWILYPLVIIGCIVITITVLQERLEEFAKFFLDSIREA